MLFPRWRIFSYIYLDHIMQKKCKLFVTCDMSQPCNMSHFEKIENFGMNCGVKSSNFGFIFEARTKSPHDGWVKWIFSDIMRGFCPSFKNEVKIWILTPPYFCDIGIFDKVAVTLTIFKQKIEKWYRSLTLVLGPLGGLFLVIFLKIWKKNIFCSVLHFSQNYWFYPIFCVKQPPY